MCVQLRTDLYANMLLLGGQVEGGCERLQNSIALELAKQVKAQSLVSVLHRE